MASPEPRLVFVGGVHRSGTSLLAGLLKAHPAVSGQRIRGMPAELEDEGQHVQSVYPVDDALGGAGAFAHNPMAHMTEAHPLATPESAARLDADWAPHWEPTVEPARVRLEKSPSNLLRTRFLQALWPDSYHIIILRHPVAVAYATAAWAARHGGGKAASNPKTIFAYALHWCRAHEILAADLARLKHVRVVRLEELVASPAAAQATLDSIFADLGLPSVPLAQVHVSLSPACSVHKRPSLSHALPARPRSPPPPQLEQAAGKGPVAADMNRKYARAFRDETEWLRNAFSSLEPRFSAFGYTNAMLGVEAPTSTPRDAPGTSESSAAAAGAAQALFGFRQLLATGATNHSATNGVTHATSAAANGGAHHDSPVAAATNGKRAGGSHSEAPKRARVSATPPSGTFALSPSISTRASPPRRPLILTLGTRGDFQPFLPLCRAMLSAGWSPLLSSLETFRPLALAADLPFAPLVPDHNAKPPPIDDPDEKAFHAGVAEFYETYGDAMLDQIRALAVSHRADLVIVGSIIFCLGFVRSLGLPVAHMRFAPYGPPPEATAAASATGAASSGTSAGATSGTGAGATPTADAPQLQLSLASQREHASQLHHAKAHARDVLRWLSAQRAHGIGSGMAREAAISRGEDLLTAMRWMKTEPTLLAYHTSCDLPSAPGTQGSPDLYSVHCGSVE